MSMDPRVAELAQMAQRLLANPQSATYADVRAYRDAYIGSRLGRSQLGGVMDPMALQSAMERANPNIRAQARQERASERPTREEIDANPDAFGVERPAPDAPTFEPYQPPVSTPPTTGGSGGAPVVGGGTGGGGFGGGQQPGGGGVGPPGLGSPGGGQPPVGGGFGPGAGPYTPNYPPPVTLPDYNTPPSGGPVVGGEPGAPANPDPGADPGRGSLPGLLASFGFAPGPAGGLLPVMLQQGGNPFQQQQNGPLYPGGVYTQPTQLSQALFNPNIQGYQWFQPPPPAPPTANPNQPPPNTGTGTGGNTGAPNYNGGYDPNTGTYYEMMRSQGLLGMPQTPAALKGLLS